MDIPQPRNAEELKQFIEQMKTLPAREQMEVALDLTKHLHALTKEVFRVEEGPTPDYTGLSTSEKLALGSQQAMRLKMLAVNIHQLKALDSVEQNLSLDKSAEQAAAALISRLKSPS